MLRSTAKYYLTKNPLGCFIALLHWGFFYKAITYLQFDSPNGISAASQIAVIGMIFFLVLDLPTIIPLMILLCPIAFLGSTKIYIAMVCFAAFFTITFQWFVIGKKITNFFWQNEDEKNALSIIKTP